MRLGEMRNVLRRVLNENSEIVIQQEPIYGGQAHLVKNYEAVILALNVLVDKKWNEANQEELKAVEAEYGKEGRERELSQEKFNQLNLYVSTINTKVPLYVSILETMVKNQDEKVINIKLPGKIDSLSDLSDVNKELEGVFKKFNLAGDFKVVGFDKGSEWYEILITASLLHVYFVSCLKVALNTCQLKKTYYESKQAKLNYLTALEEGEEQKKDDQKKHSERYIELCLKEEISEIIKEIREKNGKSYPELETELVIATKGLVKQLEKGTEFHLSLNPPEYMKRRGSELKIDYKSMPKLEESKEKKLKQIEAPKNDKK